MSLTFHCVFYAFRRWHYAVASDKYLILLLPTKLLFIFQSLVQLTTPLKNIPVNSSLDVVLALITALITELVTSLSLPKDRNQAWFFSRNTIVWHRSGAVVCLYFVMGHKSMNEWESEWVHIHDGDAVQPGPLLNKATWSQGNGSYCQRQSRQSAGHFRKISNRCLLASSLVLLGNS